MKAIGLMSGTSIDAIDVALIETDGETIQTFGPTAAYPFTLPEYQLVREAMDWAIGVAARHDRSGVLGITESMLTQKHIACVQDFARTYGINLAEIDVIGFHGQTVVHKPDKALTMQLGDGLALSRALGVKTVYDFRAADMAEGGQGAPFVPIYHRALALQSNLPLPAAFVNIGGIANITFVPEGSPEGLVAFDAGPGNCLIDDWTFQHTGTPMDKDATLALSGVVHQPTLKAMISHPFFSTEPPKSLDRGSFNLDLMPKLSPADGAATLTALTVAAIGAATRFFPATPEIWVITGGGARNPFILAGLKRVLEGRIVTAEEVGFNAEFMEAQAFAYLAARHMNRLPSTFKGTTGVQQPVIAGKLVQ